MPRPKRDVLADVEAASEPSTALPQHHLIARVIKGQGNNLFSVTAPSGESLLVELPARLRKEFLIRRGGFVIVDPDALAERDNKINGEITIVLRNEKAWRKMSYWPKEFAKKELVDDEDEEEDDESRVGQMPPSGSEEED